MNCGTAIARLADAAGGGRADGGVGHLLLDGHRRRRNPVRVSERTLFHLHSAVDHIGHVSRRKRLAEWPVVADDHDRA